MMVSIIDCRIGHMGFNQIISVDIKVPNRLVGLGTFHYFRLSISLLKLLFFALIVIGRQGEMINKLQSESSAKIQVAPGMCIECLRFSIVVYFLYYS